MDLSTITAADFKAQFSRDFPFLPLYDSTVAYFEDDVVYLPSKGQFYKCLVDDTTGVSPDTSVAKWKRVKQSTDNYVADADITRAFTAADPLFNQALFGDDNTIKWVFLYCAAHFLAVNIRTAREGVDSVGTGLMVSKGAGGVNTAYQIPQEIIDDAVLGQFYKTGYGQQYLGYVLPALRGNVVAVGGWTQP